MRARLPRLLHAREAEAETPGPEAQRVRERYFSPETGVWTVAHACIDDSNRIRLPSHLLAPPRAHLEPTFLKSARRVRASIHWMARS